MPGHHGRRVYASTDVFVALFSFQVQWRALVNLLSAWVANREHFRYGFVLHFHFYCDWL